jgi:glycosyltransferase involved in cell wall biosynthesis
LKIALETMGGQQWYSGQVLLHNLVFGVRQLRLHDVELALISSQEEGTLRDYAQSIGMEGYLHYHKPRRWSMRELTNGLYKRLFHSDRFLEKILRENGINVLFGPVLLFNCSGVATLSWLWDFQHTHLPEMFSKEERSNRDSNFMQSAKSATRIIVLSEAVKKDFQDFAPLHASKARVLSPISRIPEITYESDPGTIVRLYHLPDKFVYLPNQFWKHKNHELVFRAVKNLKEKGIKVTVVCTGYPGDYRHSGYFASLWQKVSEWDLRRQIIYLGLIPYAHVLSLIRQSVCVINPSRFEGWGMTVDEARSVGKRALVSDIPAHREQNSPGAIYFSPEDCQDLEAKLAQIWNNTASGPDEEFEREARLKLPERLSSYAQAFVSISREAYQEHPL